MVSLKKKERRRRRTLASRVKVKTQAGEQQRVGDVKSEEIDSSHKKK